MVILNLTETERSGTQPTIYVPSEGIPSFRITLDKMVHALGSYSGPLTWQSCGLATILYSLKEKPYCGSKPTFKF